MTDMRKRASGTTRRPAESITRRPADGRAADGRATDGRVADAVSDIGLDLGPERPTTPRERWLRRLYAAALAATPLAGRRGCADPERLVDLALRRAPERRRLETLDHAMACRACHGEFALLWALGRAAEGSD